VSERDDVPPDLKGLDHALHGVEFRPRESLGPEMLGRLRRGEASKGAVSPRRRRPALGALAAAAAAVLALGVTLTHGTPAQVAVDRCCYDLDGGGDADDGVLVVGERDARVHQLRIYEDLDGSRTFSSGDIVRLDRGGSPAMHESAASGLVTIEHCCLDFDGGGPADDGLVVIGVPPDRVVMAAIYERPSGLENRRAASGGLPLR
jgi:hypothetical protein